MNIRKLTLLFFLALMMNVKGQLGKEYLGTYLEAAYCMMEMDYKAALDHFESLISVSPDNHNLYFLMGDCCLKINSKTQQAITYLERAVKEVDASYKGNSYKEHRAPPEAYLLLARAYHQNNQFYKAIDNYVSYRDFIRADKFSEIEYANRQIKSCELAMSMINSPLKVKFHAVFTDMPQELPHSNPVVSGNDSVIIYLVNKISNNSVMMTYLEEKGWSRARKLNVELGITGDFFPVSLSFDGHELYLVKQDYYDSQLFVSRFENGRWGKVLELNENINTRYYETHASISRDGSTLYFTSDRKGGYGGLDIYMSQRNIDESWGEAINLGGTINTVYNEDTPFITRNDSKLYFSSEGHQTMGGYDIFSSERNAEDYWTLPENLGYPINTSKNDLFYNPGWDDKYSYYAWYVPGRDLKQLKKIFINPAGKNTVNGDQGSEGKSKDERVVNTEEIQYSSSHLDSREYLTLNSILFDFNSFNLNDNAITEVDRILKVMQDLPGIILELTGHADSKGLAEYNLQLSLQRARSVAQYLIDRGILAERIISYGSGEKAPVAINEYEDGSDAPRGRLLNRHTSLKFRNLPDDRIQVAELLVPERLKPVSDRSYAVLLTENELEIPKMPDQFYGKPVGHIKAEGSHLYLVEAFPAEEDAVEFLNKAIDYGFPEARIFDRHELNQLVSGNADENMYADNRFTIQIMALKKLREDSYFKELGLVTRYTGKDGLNRYTTGTYASKEDAREELRLVREKGYKNAFIIPVQECKQRSIIDGPSAIMATNR